MRWCQEAQPVHGIESVTFIPPYVPHQEINASPEEPLECVLVRSDQKPVVVNLPITPVESPEEVAWVDPGHP